MASSFIDLLEQINEELEEAPEEFSKECLELSDDSLPLSDQIANEILMHRNSHFGGKFEFMKEYYLEEGIGVQPDIELEEIIELEQFEAQIGQDLAPIALSKPEIEKVKCSLRMYRALQKICSISQDVNSVPTLLAELILTEEASPTSEMGKLSKTEKALPYLFELLKTEEFFDPVFPGYGRTPLHVATILGEMGSEKAIIPLFESMKSDQFMYEEAAILALKKIGAPAFDFLMNVLKKSPITQDNEKAAIALMSFENKEPFAKLALEMIQQFEVLGHFNLAVQLILACLDLKDPKDIQDFLKLKDQIPKALDPDFHYVSSQLKKLI